MVPSEEIIEHLLYWAVDRNRIEIVEFLLEKDFDNAHQADKDG